MEKCGQLAVKLLDDTPSLTGLSLMKMVVIMLTVAHFYFMLTVTLLSYENLSVNNTMK